MSPLKDHSDYEHSAKGLENAYIISIIDHHGDGSVRTGNQLIYDAVPLGATATVVWLRYRNYGQEPDKQTAAVMLGSILSDTHNLEYNNTTDADREAVNDLAELAKISDLNAFFEGMEDAAISYRNMTDEKIFFSDYKENEASGKHYAIACLNARNQGAAEDLSVRMTQLMPSVLESKGLDMAFAQISINKKDASYTYLVPSNDMAADVIEKAFGDKVLYSGTAYVMTPGVSRKAVIVPAFNEVLKSTPDFHDRVHPDRDKLNPVIIGSRTLPDFG